MALVSLVSLVSLVRGSQSWASHPWAIHPGVIMVVPRERQEGGGLRDVESGAAGHDDSRHGQHRPSLLARTLAWLGGSRLRLLVLGLRLGLLGLRLGLGCLAG